MKKFIATSGMAIALLVSPFITSAEESDVSSPEIFVKEYIELGKSHDYEKLVDLVVDDRFLDDRQLKLETYKMLQEDVPELENYEITEVKEVTEEKATVITVLTFKDGSIEQRPMNLVKNDNQWKLHISDTDANEDQNFEQIKDPEINMVEQETFNELSFAIAAARGPLTMSYQYWERAGGAEFYSNAIFDTKVKNSFALVATQTHNFTQSHVVRLRYLIVKPASFLGSDAEWGSAYKTGNYPTVPFEGSIPRDSGAPRYTNAKMKFKTNPGFTSGMGYAGQGNLFEY